MQMRGLERVAQPVDHDRWRGAADADELSDGRAQTGAISSSLLTNDGAPSTGRTAGLVADATLGADVSGVDIDLVQRGHSHSVEEATLGTLLAGDVTAHVLAVTEPYDVVRRRWDLEAHGLDQIIGFILSAIQGNS